MPPPFDASLLRTAAELCQLAQQPRRAKPSVAQVRHGVWVDAAVWAALDPRARHEAKAHATALMARPDRPPIFSCTASAAVWGMPRIESWPRRTHVTRRSGAASSNASVLRHLDPEVEAVQRNGLWVTSPARTVADLAQSSSLASAVAAADHALRHGLCTRAELVAAAKAVEPNARLRTRPMLVAELADGGSMSAGESLSRVQMFLLHIPRPRLQVEVHDDEGLAGTTDFGWDGAVGEFDGKVKYNVPEDATPAEASQVLWHEKRREDRIRRRGLGFARWVWGQAQHPASLLAVLADVGIRPEPRQRWFVD